MKAPTGTTVLVGLTIGVVTVAIVSGLIVLGPPSEVRTQRLDEKRVEDLLGITNAVDLHWTRQGRLPLSLDALSQESGVNINSRDPATGQVYKFRVLDTDGYELCAVFQRTSTNQAKGDVSKDFWSHGVGSQCFQLQAQDIPR